MGATVPRDIYVHVCGTDLIRDADGRYLVLEDNGRTPSGVSYMLQNRQVLKRVFPQLFDNYDVRADRRLPGRPAGRARSTSRPAAGPIRPSCCSVPGIYNSAYFEHTFLAQRMGIELVEGRDLVVDQNRVFMRTTRGLRAGGRDLSPHRRRLPRPADVPSRQHPRRAGAGQRLPGRATSRWPTASAPASPTTRASIPSCRT